MTDPYEEAGYPNENDSYVKRLEIKAMISLGLHDVIKRIHAEANNSGLPIGPNDGIGTPIDAYKHILVTAEITRRKGELAGKAAGLSHEIRNLFDGQQSRKDWKMDDNINNPIGVEIGKTAKTWEEVVRGARKAISKAAEHGGDGKEGRAFWYEKPKDRDCARTGPRCP